MDWSDWIQAMERNIITSPTMCVEPCTTSIQSLRWQEKRVLFVAAQKPVICSAKGVSHNDNEMILRNLRTS